MLWLFRGSSKECLLHWMQSQAAFSNSHHQFSRRGKIEESKLETSFPSPFSLHFLSCTKVHFNWISLSGTKSHTKSIFCPKKKIQILTFMNFCAKILLIFNFYTFQWMKRGSVFYHIMDTFGSSGELDVNRPVFWAYMPFLDALSNFRP